MRKSLPTLAFMVTVVTTAGLITPTVAEAAASKATKTTRTNVHAEEHEAEHAGQKKLPAPPKPAKLKPSQRIVVGGAAKTTAEIKATVAATAQTTATATAVVGKSGNAVTGAIGTGKTLVLYDNTGPYGWLGEVYAEQTANLVSHFNGWTAHPVGQYTAGELNAYNAVVYVGSTYDEPVPVAFLDDVTASTKPVVWMYDNIWQLTARDTTFAASRGYTWKGFDTAAVSTVNYKGTVLTRDTINQSGIMDYAIYDAAKATTVATAVRPDGTTFPWAVRSGNLTYVGEIPFAYVTHDDRYLAFADLLYDALAPKAVTRHRALVRVEDVGPDADPAELRAVTNYLYSKRIPFTVAVYPRYRDPKGVNNGGKAQDYTLASKPKVVTELKYMQSHGGTLLMHGYTHQYNSVANPYDGVSANDFEFYRAHVDTANNVIYDGPVAEDSASYVTSRVMAGGLAFLGAGLGVPSIFEFPHYAGSATDYSTINSLFGKRYDRGLYYPGVLSGTKADYTKMSGQFFPYAVRDVYGSNVIPENIGNIEPEPFNNHPARLPADLIASAKRNLAIRDGMASFFYHPYLGTSYLKQTVDGIQGLGYTFVTANSTIS
jgi:uncharacterized protein YdaL